MKVRLACLGGALAVCIVLGPLRAGGEEKPGSDHTDLSGHWKLNKKLSDDEQAKLRATDLDGGRGEPSDRETGSDAEREGSDRGRGAYGGHGAAERSPASVAAPDDDPRGPQRPAAPWDSLKITETDLQIVVEGNGGQTRYLYPNGKTYKADDGASEVRTHWKDGALLFEKKNVRGWRETETWRLSPERNRLRVELLFEGGKRPRLSFTRVYDRAEEPGGETPVRPPT
jgi:hypothetical protein